MSPALPPGWYILPGGAGVFGAGQDGTERAGFGDTLKMDVAISTERKTPSLRIFIILLPLSFLLFVFQDQRG